MTVEHESHEIDNYDGPSFGELRIFLQDTEPDSPQALATLDVADKYAICGLMMAGGGIACRLAADRRNNRRGNFRRRTDGMFETENHYRDEANEVTSRIMLRQSDDPTYKQAIEFLTDNVIRGIDEESNKPREAKMRRIVGGFRSIVAETCTEQQ